MKGIFIVVALAITSAPAFAAKDCEELKKEIAAKLEAKGVKTAKLEIVATEEIKDQKVVGSCEGGKKKITYTRE